MPKSLAVQPELTRQPGHLKQRDIPLHTYARPFAEERGAWGDEVLRQVLRHMLVIREFELMLASFKAKGSYADINYIYKGPAHLSVGQEAAAVGQALALQPDDHILGSHRSHGEFIAKSLAAIARLDDAELIRMMASHQEGELLRAVERHLPGADVRQTAEHFALLGLLAEIFMRSNGFNRGMGGSMHAFFPPFGVFPNNAIVGGSAGIAAGVALHKKLRNEATIAVANSGDGSTGCGPVWEAMNLAAMGQYRSLWQTERPGGLPVLFFFTNNFYAMGGQTSGETMGWDRLSRIGSGINADGLHAETVDGTNPLAVADAVSRMRQRLVQGQGPALLDVECYRFSGHSTTDTNVYRTKEEIAAWEAHDPIRSFETQLLGAGVMTEAEVQALRTSVLQTVRAVTASAVDPAICPPVDIASHPTLIGELMFADTVTPLPDAKASDVAALENSARIRQDAKKSRFGLSLEGEKLSPMRAITLRDGLFEAILNHLVHDERLIAYGEECREWGGAFGVYRGLSDLLPHHRLFNAPISEAAIVASAVGYALAGGRALVELMYGDFIGRAGDEIFNQMAKWHAMSGGVLKVPVVLRCSVGSKYGAQHSQDWSALIAHIPGLKVIYPATPHDAKGLMATALAGDDPVVVFESQRLYDMTEQFQTGGVPPEYYRLPLGQPDIKRPGQDLTILTIGPSLYPALDAARTLQAEHGLSAEVIDARCLVPFDYDLVLASLKKTGRLMIVSEASERGSFAMTLASQISRHGFADLRCPVRVLGSPNWIVPGADMESTYFPQAHDIVDVALLELMGDTQRRPQGVRRWSDIELARRGL